jgi:glutamine synthetase
VKRVLKRADALGVIPMCGMEYEWFNFAETPARGQRKRRGPTTITPGMFGYSLLRANANRDSFAALMIEMGDFGVPIEGLHTETGPRVRGSDPVLEALEAADRAILFKTGAKETRALRHHAELWRNGTSICRAVRAYSSIAVGWQENLLYDAKSANRMSKLFESYLAGQIAGLMELAPVLADDQQLQAVGRWFLAPVKPPGALDNRTASLCGQPAEGHAFETGAQAPI